MRFLGLVAACALVACGSSDARVQHPGELEFGNVEVGESLTATLRIGNSGEKDAQLSLSVEPADFTLEQLTLTVPAGTSTLVTVHFAPKALGPRVGLLQLGSSSVALSGRGVGPQLSGPEELTVRPLAIVTGEPTEVFTTTVILRNTGTAGALLRLRTPRVEGSDELCVGTITDSGCEAWQPPEILDARTLLEVPLSVLPRSEGTKRWTVRFPSNDPLQPEVTLEVRANVETFEPCQFVAPSNFVLRTTGVLRLRHTGPGTCLVREVSVNPNLIGVSTPPLPLRLGSNSTLDVVLRAPEHGFFPCQLRVLAAGTEPFEVFFRFEGPMTDCLVVTPEQFDFGSIPLTCGTPTREGRIYNQCAEPVVIESVVIAHAAGVAPGTPGCRGPAPCPEFSILSGIPAGTVLPSGGPGVPFTLAYQPLDFGADTGALVISARDRSPLLFSLWGRGALPARNTDTYRNDPPLPVVDVLVMVDTSPSFRPRRKNVRDNLLPILNYLGNGCFDARFALAPADGDPAAAVQLQVNDAGQRWTASSDPQFVARALSAFDALPVGSELEACIGPAADLIDDAGVRDGGLFSGICITDALEQSVDPLGALARLQRRVRSPYSARWSSIAGAGGRCSVEAHDDGVHDWLVTSSFGVREDVCNPAWGRSLVGFGSTCSRRSQYYLSSRPVGPIEVRIEGVLIPSTNWTYDASQNAVAFLPAFAPPPGATLTFTYDTAFCSP